MNVDVVSEIEIERPRAEIADFSGDPANAPLWYVNIKQAVWQTTPAGVVDSLALGSRIDFVAHFLGRKLAYTYEIVELEHHRKLVMRTAQGPFPMETTYTWDDASEGKTRMTLRNRGAPSGFASLVAPLMASAMKRATTKDLARLKAVLESRA